LSPRGVWPIIARSAVCARSQIRPHRLAALLGSRAGPPTCRLVGRIGGYRTSLGSVNRSLYMAITGRAGSKLAPPLLDTIQRGTMAYTYKGIPALKNPFDWAVYPMLVWEKRPQTIIEIGS